VAGWDVPGQVQAEQGIGVACAHGGQHVLQRLHRYQALGFGQRGFAQAAFGKQLVHAQASRLGARQGMLQVPRRDPAQRRIVDDLRHRRTRYPVVCKACRILSQLRLVSRAWPFLMT
jgi:hypothetical protein